MARGFTGGFNLQNTTLSVVTATPCTFVAWVSQDSSHTGGIMACGAANDEFVLMTVSSAIWALVQDSGGNTQAVSSGSLSTGVLAHVCAVYRSSTDRSAYINGANRGNNATSKAPNSANMNKTVIGGRYSAAQPFNGTIAEAAVWNTDLSDDEIAALGKGLSPLSIRPNSLVSYWPVLGRYSPEIDVIGKTDLTVSGAAHRAHPRIIYPNAPWLTRAAGVGGGTGARSFAAVIG